MDECAENSLELLHEEIPENTWYWSDYDDRQWDEEQMIMCVYNVYIGLQPTRGGTISIEEVPLWCRYHLEQVVTNAE